jgi:hypothetical protein
MATKKYPATEASGPKIRGTSRNYLGVRSTLRTNNVKEVCEGTAKRKLQSEFT